VVPGVARLLAKQGRRERDGKPKASAEKRPPLKAALVGGKCPMREGHCNDTLLLPTGYEPRVRAGSFGKYSTEGRQKKRRRIAPCRPKSRPTCTLRGNGVKGALRRRKGTRPVPMETVVGDCAEARWNLSRRGRVAPLARLAALGGA